MMIVVIDYEMGNIQSIVGALRYLGIQNIVISSHYSDIKKADRLILPGVGAFGRAMKNIQEKNLDAYLQEVVIHHKKPILGICLGMQLMGVSSTEHGEHFGLRFIGGISTQLNSANVKVPHVGFNQVSIKPNLKLYDGMEGDIDFYFTHSYKMTSSSSINQCMCHYDVDFIASYEKDNIAGVQFHPELSQRNGLSVIKNFIEKF